MEANWILDATGIHYDGPDYAKMVLTRELESRQRKLEDMDPLYRKNPSLLHNPYYETIREIYSLKEAIRKLEAPKFTVHNGGMSEPRTNQTIRDSGGDRD